MILEVEETRPENDEDEDEEEGVVLATRPVSTGEEKLREKFADVKAGQSDLMDALARQLITIELAIPGLYATALKLIQGDKATLAVDYWVIAAFACWFVALVLTVISLFPREWAVDQSRPRSDAAGRSQMLSLEDFFYETARYKRNLLAAAILVFFVGIISAAMAIFV